jgi:hypothetical protein
VKYWDQPHEKMLFGIRAINAWHAWQHVLVGHTGQVEVKTGGQKQARTGSRSKSTIARL